ncbi:MAG: hypothetical protein N5P05_002396 [Chroococcopsis gigantea SAG 12.99]|nr:hypothetical protein [Chroococcopsis gigantea SAG 12.99]
MALSNHQRVGQALEILTRGIYPFIAREMKNRYGEGWISIALDTFSDNYKSKKADESALEEDLAALLKLMCDHWHEVFKKTLGHSERSLVSELRDTRNSWAHSNTFTFDNAYRAYDSIARLLSAVSADTAEIEHQKRELMRVTYEDQARRETRRIASIATGGEPMAGLKPWREIATPHQDVASGRYQQAEFAADLWQVYLDEGSDEYRLPDEFFRRTYLTEGLKQLLGNALIRLTVRGGDPVIELQTNFGGGKTHAMLALFHLFSGAKAQDLPGIESVFASAGITTLPGNVQTAVIVGNKISPGSIQKKKDGTGVRTLWGEIAYQLGGREAYEMIREADETATNPGDALKTLFNRYAPCMILVDEWVSYARQLHDRADLPGGSFDTHFTFAQTLSESAKNADRTLLVVSIPSSDIEIGGDNGKEALDRLKNAIGRVESPWRPASAEESFEIVRRRLFQTTTEATLFKDRDAVVRSFSEMYRGQAQEFPSECREAHYEKRLREAYPIHPEFFDRLYSDWSTIDKFQRTRGVLRLMAKVIHCLWERGDRSPLIMPAHLPMDDAGVQSELTRYLDDNWVPIIEKDVDGPNSLPLELDSNPNLGRYSACRRVARTVYLGSAPTYRVANRGIDEQRIKLGCVQPGERTSTFADALRKLSDRATYLYLDNSRYWISTQPNVTRTANDRANQLLEEKHKITQEIIRRLKGDRERAKFGAVHIAPESSGDVGDEANLGVRLVILGPNEQHSKGLEDSPARVFSEEILHYRGNAPRYHKNTLIFLAPEKSTIDSLEKDVAGYLAWKEIVEEKDALNLDVGQSKQATFKKEQTDKTVGKLLNQTYCWLLFPEQEDPKNPMVWREGKLQSGDDSPVARAARKLLNDDCLLETYAPLRLRMDVLDKYIWHETPHIDLDKLAGYLTRYIYMPRLQNTAVLLAAVKEGLLSIDDKASFAYAEGWDESKGEYINLARFRHIEPGIGDRCLLVRSDVARKQIEAEIVPPPPIENLTRAHGYGHEYPRFRRPPPRR